MIRVSATARSKRRGSSEKPGARARTTQGIADHARASSTICVSSRRVKTRVAKRLAAPSSPVSERPA